jgi:predicted phage terminase large subunit-like protein
MAHHVWSSRLGWELYAGRKNHTGDLPRLLYQSTTHSTMNPLLRSPLGISIYTGGGMRTAPPHLIMIDEALIRLVLNQYDKLVVLVPPRHGKSELVSVAFVFWYLMHNPTHRILLSSYGDSLATYFGRKARDLFANYKGITGGLTLDESSQSKGDWNLQGYEGGLRATGAGGAITGRGFNIGIIDDIVKNPEEGLNAKHHDQLWDWFESTFRSRKEPGAKEIVVGHRWQKDDFIGRYLKQAGSERTKVLTFPAIAMDGDVLGRKPGEALWRERYDEQALMDRKVEVGSYWWSALYQQSPMDVVGNLFKRHFIKYFNLIPADGALYLEYDEQGIHRINAASCFWFATSDLNADGEGANKDYFVLQTWVYYEGKLFCIDQLRELIGTLQHEEQFIQHHIKWSKRAKIVGVEKVAYQSSLVKRLQRRGLPVVALKPEGNKVIRAIPCAAMMENGKVYFNSSLPDLEGTIDELCEFPNGEHDDRVDCVAYAQSMVTRYAGGLKVSNG